MKLLISLLLVFSFTIVKAQDANPVTGTITSDLIDVIDFSSYQSERRHVALVLNMYHEPIEIVYRREGRMVMAVIPVDGAILITLPQGLRNPYLFRIWAYPADHLLLEYCTDGEELQVLLYYH
jgi:hypothetical protein